MTWQQRTVRRYLLRPQGCTRNELREALDWPSISMQLVSKRLNLGLRIDRTRRPWRYYGLIQ